MNKYQILNFLTNAKPELIKRFNISSIAILGLQFCLEDRLESPIDLVTEKALRDELRPYNEKETIYVNLRAYTNFLLQFKTI